MQKVFTSAEELSPVLVQYTMQGVLDVERHNNGDVTIVYQTLSKPIEDIQPQIVDLLAGLGYPISTANYMAQAMLEQANKIAISLDIAERITQVK